MLLASVLRGFSPPSPFEPLARVSVQVTQPLLVHVLLWKVVVDFLRSASQAAGAPHRKQVLPGTGAFSCRIVGVSARRLARTLDPSPQGDPFVGHPWVVGTECPFLHTIPEQNHSYNRNHRNMQQVRYCVEAAMEDVVWRMLLYGRTERREPFSMGSWTWRPMEFRVRLGLKKCGPVRLGTTSPR